MIMYNPADIMLAYRYAQRKHPQARERLRRAEINWSDAPESAGAEASGMALAVASAEEYGCGAVFLDSVADVVEAQATEQAAIAPGSADESYVSWVMDQIKAAPDRANEILVAASRYSPTEQAKEAATSAANSWLEAARAAQRATLDKLSENTRAAAAMIERQLKRGQDIGALTLLGMAGIIGLAVYASRKK